MEKKAVIMDESAIRRAITRITYEILERNRGADLLCIVGILSRGVVLAERIAKKIYELEHVKVDFGALDITPYRDDRTPDSEVTVKSRIPFLCRTSVSLLWTMFSILGAAVVLRSMRFWKTVGRSRCSLRCSLTVDIGSFRSGRITWERTCRRHKRRRYAFTQVKQMVWIVR